MTATIAAAYKVKAVAFKADDATYPGETRYLAGKLAPSGKRVSWWCRHYHDSEESARACPAIAEAKAARSADDVCPGCGDFLAWCPDTPEFHSQREV
ncbi:hypothetical protein SEA_YOUREADOPTED_76 [Mycobacterium phage YoureAdopted]|nr:hypothetical protein SEA_YOUREADOPTED_76 [Mycobacterium phage YoureAdopted]